jgi:hypothetical protein
VLREIPGSKLATITVLLLLLLLILLLILSASGYVPGGSGTTIHNTIQCNTIHKKHKITHTLKTIHNAKITNTITQNYKHNAQKEREV